MSEDKFKKIYATEISKKDDSIEINIELSLPREMVLNEDASVTKERADAIKRIENGFNTYKEEGAEIKIEPGKEGNTFTLIITGESKAREDSALELFDKNIIKQSPVVHNELAKIFPSVKAELEKQKAAEEAAKKEAEKNASTNADDSTTNQAAELKLNNAEEVSEQIVVDSSSHKALGFASLGFAPGQFFGQKLDAIVNAYNRFTIGAPIVAENESKILAQGYFEQQREKLIEANQKAIENLELEKNATEENLEILRIAKETGIENINELEKTILAFKPIHPSILERGEFYLAGAGDERTPTGALTSTREDFLDYIKRTKGSLDLLQGDETDRIKGLQATINRIKELQEKAGEPGSLTDPKFFEDALAIPELRKTHAEDRLEDIIKSKLKIALAESDLEQSERAFDIYKQEMGIAADTDADGRDADVDEGLKDAFAGMEKSVEQAQRVLEIEVDNAQKLAELGGIEIKLELFLEELEVKQLAAQETLSLSGSSSSGGGLKPIADALNNLEGLTRDILTELDITQEQLDTALLEQGGSPNELAERILGVIQSKADVAKVESKIYKDLIRDVERDLNDIDKVRIRLRSSALNLEEAQKSIDEEIGVKDALEKAGIDPSSKYGSEKVAKQQEEVDGRIEDYQKALKSADKLQEELGFENGLIFQGPGDSVPEIKNVALAAIESANRRANTAFELRDGEIVPKPGVKFDFTNEGAQTRFLNELSKIAKGFDVAEGRETGDTLSEWLNLPEAQVERSVKQFGSFPNDEHINPIDGEKVTTARLGEELRQQILDLQGQRTVLSQQDADANLIPINDKIKAAIDEYQDFLEEYSEFRVQQEIFAALHKGVNEITVDNVEEGKLLLRTIDGMKQTGQLGDSSHNTLKVDIEAKMVRFVPQKSIEDIAIDEARQQALFGRERDEYIKARVDAEKSRLEAAKMDGDAGAEGDPVKAAENEIAKIENQIAEENSNFEAGLKEIDGKLGNIDNLSEEEIFNAAQLADASSISRENFHPDMDTLEEAASIFQPIESITQAQNATDFFTNLGIGMTNPVLGGAMLARVAASLITGKAFMSREQTVKMKYITERRYEELNKKDGDTVQQSGVLPKGMDQQARFALNREGLEKLFVEEVGIWEDKKGKEKIGSLTRSAMRELLKENKDKYKNNDALLRVDAKEKVLNRIEKEYGEISAKNLSAQKEAEEVGNYKVRINKENTIVVGLGNKNEGVGGSMKGFAVNMGKGFLKMMTEVPAKAVAWSITKDGREHFKEKLVEHDVSGAAHAARKNGIINIGFAAALVAAIGIGTGGLGMALTPLILGVVAGAAHGIKAAADKAAPKDEKTLAENKRYGDWLQNRKETGKASRGESLPVFGVNKTSPFRP